MNRGDFDTQIQEAAEKACDEALVEALSQITMRDADHYQLRALDLVAWVKVKLPEATVNSETVVKELGKAPTGSP